MDAERTKRQAIIKGWSQSNLNEKTAVVIGAGALGNHLCAALAALGVGTIKLIDFDEIELHNLNRQFMFTESDVKQNKAEALAKRLEERNGEINIVPISDKVTDENIEILIGEPDILIDCVDLIHVRRTLSKYALEMNIPFIHGGISWYGWEASVMTRETACINCLYPQSLQEAEKETITSCIKKEEASVVYTGQMCGSFMANLARKVLMPLPSDASYKNILYKYDERLQVPFYQNKMQRKADCEDCLPILKDMDKKAYDIALKEIEKEKKDSDDALGELF